MIKLINFRYALLAITLFLYTNAIFAETKENKITGIVTNSQGKTLDGALITTINVADSTVIAYIVSDTLGHFNTPNYPKQNTILEVSYLGYEKLYIKPSLKFMEIALKDDMQHIDEAVIQGRKQTIERIAGKFIFSPKETTFLKGENGFNLLKYAPLINIQDDNISMLGKGSVTIYINGREPKMSQEAVITMLRALPANRITQVEVITSPNSSYKASTSGGVVNVKIKSDPNQGVIGNVSAGLSYFKDKLSPSGSLYLAYGKDKFSISTSLSTSSYNRLDKTETIYKYKNTGININSLSKNETASTSFFGNLNLAYEINKNSKIGATLNASHLDYNTNNNINSDYYSKKGVDSILNASNIVEPSKIKPPISASLYYTLNTDSLGSNLDFSVSYADSYSNYTTSSSYSKQIKNNNIDIYDQFNQNKILDIDSYEAKASFNKYFKDDSFLETGYQINISNINNTFNKGNYNGSEYVTDDIYSNDFEYNEIINAAYVSYKRDWNDIFSSVIGVRGEYSNIKSHLRTTNSENKQEYFNLFPNLSLSFDLAEGDHNLSFDYYSSIYRPPYNILNPFKTLVSEDKYIVGNENLNPEISHSSSIYYTLKQDYIFSLYYYYNKNSMYDYTGIDNNNKTVTTVINLDNSHYLGFSFELRKQLFNDYLYTSAQLSAYYDYSTGGAFNQDLSYESWSGSFSWENNITLSKKYNYSISLTYAYSTASVILNKNFEANHRLFLDLKKSFKFGGTLKIGISNILNNPVKIHFDSQDYSYNINPLTSIRSLTISYSQTFGSKRIKTPSNRSYRNISSRSSN